MSVQSESMDVKDEEGASRLNGMMRWFESLIAGWCRCSVRVQILKAVAIASALTWGIGVALTMLDANSRTLVEIQASLDLLESYIGVKIAGIKEHQDLERFAADLGKELRHYRHVEFTLLDRDGMRVSDSALVVETHGERVEAGDDRAPGWFIALVEPRLEKRIIPIAFGPDEIGSVVLTGKPDDEISESWVALQQITLLWIGAMLFMMCGLHIVLGYLLRPLLFFAAAMRQLENGQYSCRLAMPRLKELQPIAENFNTLAGALKQACADNSRLYQELVVLQERERWQIASDLHDEFGPCLFGIRASACAIERRIKQMSDKDAHDMLASVQEIVKITDHMKQVNRSLLGRLRPMALGKVTVIELLHELISDFQQRHLDVEFQFSFPDHLPGSLGEAVDLTLYRCLQEGLTNALRHGEADKIVVTIQVTSLPTRTLVGLRFLEQDYVDLRIADNGKGIAAEIVLGFGLSSMRERARLIAGTLSIQRLEPTGAELVVRVPVLSANGNEGTNQVGRVNQ